MHMDPAEIASLLRDDLDNPELWAVYADALLAATADASDEARAKAIAAELSGAAARPVPHPEGWEGPVDTDVEWWRGHWRGLVVRAPQQLPELLSHPAARFLRELVLVASREHPNHDWGLPDALPTTLQRAELHLRPGRGLAPRLVADLLGRVRSLEVKGVALPIRGRAPRLETLALDDGVPHERAELPVLARLLVCGPEAVEALLRSRARFPRLRTLAVRDRLEPDLLASLLASPLGRGLDRLVVEGDRLLAWAVAHPRAWRHLSRLTLDVRSYDPHLKRSERLVVRTLGHPARYAPAVRLAPPAQRRTQVRAARQALADLGLRVVRVSESDWLRVPAPVGEALARRMARRAGSPAEVLRAETHLEWSNGRATRMDASIRGLTFDPDGLRRGATSELARRSHEAFDLPNDHDARDYGDHLVDMLWDGVDVEEQLRFAVPAGWTADEWPLDGPPPCGPRQIDADGNVLDLSPELGGYLAWRTIHAGLLQRVPAPDLSRWTGRLLRRYGLRAEPDDPDHPFWADWATRTLEERSHAPSGRFIPSFKVLSPGRWVMGEHEVRRWRDGLRAPPEGHRVPQGLGLDRLRAFLEHYDAVQVRVAMLSPSGDQRASGDSGGATTSTSTASGWTAV